MLSFEFCKIIQNKYFLKHLGTTTSSSRHSQMFFKLGALTNFGIFTGKQLCRSLFLIKRLQHRCFFVNTAKFLRIAFFIEHLLGLVLYFGVKFLYIGCSDTSAPFVVRNKTVYKTSLMGPYTLS